MYIEAVEWIKRGRKGVVIEAVHVQPQNALNIGLYNYYEEMDTIMLVMYNNIMYVLQDMRIQNLCMIDLPLTVYN